MSLPRLTTPGYTNFPNSNLALSGVGYFGTLEIFGSTGNHTVPMGGSLTTEPLEVVGFNCFMLVLQRTAGLGTYDECVIVLMDPEAIGTQLIGASLFMLSAGPTLDRAYFGRGQAAPASQDDVLFVYHTIQIVLVEAGIAAITITAGKLLCGVMP
jgi:hypothetical protein